MAQSDQERKELLKRFRKELVKPLESVGIVVGELQETFNQQIEADLSIAAVVGDGFRQHFDNWFWAQLAVADATIDDLRLSYEIALKSRLGAVGETIAHSGLGAMPVGLPDGSGFIAGSDTRTADEKAADPLTPGGCPPVVSRHSSSPPAYQPTTPILPSPTPPTTPSPTAPTSPESDNPISRLSAAGFGFGSIPCTDDAYKVLAAEQENLLGNVAAIRGKALGGIQSDVLGVVFDTLQSLSPLGKLLPNMGDKVQNAFGELAAAMATKIEPGGCLSPIIVAGLIQDFVVGVLKIVGFPTVPQIEQPQTYIRNLLCPVMFPTADQAAVAFLGNTISEETLQTWVKQNGLCWPPYQKVIDSQRSKPAPLDLAAMNRRKIIDDSAYRQAMREIGFTRPGDVSNLFKLTEYVPGPADLIRFMVRDVADDKLFGKAGGDDDLAAKWTGDVEKWGDSQGISRDVALAYWRAHWHLPSPGQLFEFYHRWRFKPEYGGPEAFKELIKETLVQQDIQPRWIEPFLAVSFRPLTRVDVRRAYDIGALPIEAVENSYLDLGYSDDNAKVLTRFTERLRESKIGNSGPVKQWKAELIDRQKAAAKLKADKYTDAAIAEALDIAARQQKNHSAVKRFGKYLITAIDAARELAAHGIPDNVFQPWLSVAEQNFRNHPAVKQFASGVILRADAAAWLDRFNIPPDTYNPWLDEAANSVAAPRDVKLFGNGIIDKEAAMNRLTAEGVTAERAGLMLSRMRDELIVETRFTCAKFLKDRFLRGEFDAEEYQRILVGNGIPVEHAEQMKQRAQCELSAMGKDPSTAQLCQWLELGMIQPVDFVDRLETLGWEHGDAINILTACTSKISAARAKAAEKEAKDNAAAVAKLQRQQKAVDAAVKKDLAERGKKSEAAKKARDRREAQILGAADHLRKLAGLSLPDSVMIVREEKQRVQIENALTVDDAIQAVVLAAENYDQNSGASFAEQVNTAAASVLSAQAEVAAGNGSPLTNS